MRLSSQHMRHFVPDYLVGAHVRLEDDLILKGSFAKVDLLSHTRRAGSPWASSAPVQENAEGSMGLTSGEASFMVHPWSSHGIAFRRIA